ncbi:MAG: hypothetical protein PHY92_06015 [Alphaproteobacteria bacterium]|nr:hypothetical protein [Alphaproteobacteria bacterium]
MKRFAEVQPFSQEQSPAAERLLVEKLLGIRLGESSSSNEISHFAPGLEKSMTPHRRHGAGANAWEADSIGVELVFVALNEDEIPLAVSYIEHRFRNCPARKIDFFARTAEGVVVNIDNPPLKVDGTRIIFQHPFLDVSKVSEGFQLVDLTGMLGTIMREVGILRRPLLNNARPLLPPCEPG